MGRYVNEEEKRIANLEKINAALLEALELMLKRFGHGRWDSERAATKQARAAIALAKQPDIDPVTNQSYCGECNKPAANCDCGEF